MDAAEWSEGKAVSKTLWGDEGWNLDEQNRLVKDGLKAVDNAVLLLDVTVLEEGEGVGPQTVSTS